jgi:hypothetical protein
MGDFGPPGYLSIVKEPGGPIGISEKKPSSTKDRIINFLLAIY